MNELGYTKPLYILPFDHKTSFITKLFALDYATLTTEQRAAVADTRMMTYEGFTKAVEMGIPRDTAAILTDEEFGDGVLKEATRQGFGTMLTTEKSGQESFTFEYGADWQGHIEKYKPQFIKALIRYNPEGDKEVNKKQLESLLPFVQYGREKGYKVLFEPLLPPTDAQLASVNGDKNVYDETLRPSLTVKMMQEFQDAHVEPDVWKIEGFTKSSAYEQVVAQARSGEGRDNVGVIILGRGGDIAHVDQWIVAGAPVDGVIGFAVGRTVFYEPIEKFHKNEMSREEAVKQIAENFYHFYKVFVENKK